MECVLNVIIALPLRASSTNTLTKNYWQPQLLGIADSALAHAMQCNGPNFVFDRMQSDDKYNRYGVY